MRVSGGTRVRPAGINGQGVAWGPWPCSPCSSLHPMLHESHRFPQIFSFPQDPGGPREVPVLVTSALFMKKLAENRLVSKAGVTGRVSLRPGSSPPSTLTCVFLFPVRLAMGMSPPCCSNFIHPNPSLTPSFTHTHQDSRSAGGEIMDIPAPRKQEHSPADGSGPGAGEAGGGAAGELGRGVLGGSASPSLRSKAPCGAHVVVSWRLRVLGSSTPVLGSLLGLHPEAPGIVLSSGDAECMALLC